MLMIWRTIFFADSIPSGSMLIVQLLLLQRRLLWSKISFGSITRDEASQIVYDAPDTSDHGHQTAVTWSCVSRLD